MGLTNAEPKANTDLHGQTRTNTDAGALWECYDEFNAERGRRAGTAAPCLTSRGQVRYRTRLAVLSLVNLTRRVADC